MVPSKNKHWLFAQPLLKRNALSMAKPSSKPFSAHVQLDYSRACKTGFFNSFSIEQVAGQFLLEFGLLKGRSVLFLFRCLLLADTVRQSRESLLHFLASIPETADPLLDCESLPSTRDFDSITSANLINASRFGELGEIRLGLFSFGHLIEQSKRASKGSVSAYPVAILHCDISMLRLFVTKLYVEQTPNV